MVQFNIRTLLLIVTGLAAVLTVASVDLYLCATKLPIFMLPVYSACFVCGLKSSKKNPLLAFGVFGFFYQWAILCPCSIGDWMLTALTTRMSADYPSDASLVRTIVSEHIGFVCAIVASAIYSRFAQKHLIESIILQSENERSVWFRKVFCVLVSYAVFAFVSVLIDDQGALWNLFIASLVSTALLTCFNTSGARQLACASFGTLAGVLYMRSAELLPLHTTSAFLSRFPVSESVNRVSFNYAVNSQILLLLSFVFAFLMTRKGTFIKNDDWK